MSTSTPPRPLAIALVALAVLAAGCGDQEDAGAAGQSGPDTTDTGGESGADAAKVSQPAELTVAPAAPGLPFLPLFIARREGMFADRDLAVEVVEARGAEAVAAVESGQAEVVMTLPELVIGPRAQGSDLTLIGTTIEENLFALYTTDDIDSLDDLAGEQVGIHVEGTATELHLRWLLDEHGAGASESTFVSSGGPPARLAALREQEISGGLLLPEFGVPAERAGLKRLAELAEFDTGYPIGVVGATETTLANRPQDMRAFMAGLVEAIQFTVDHPEAAVDAASDILEAEREALTDAYDATRDAYATDGAIPDKGLQWAMEQMRRYGNLDEVPEVDQVYDAGFLPEP